MGLYIFIIYIHIYSYTYTYYTRASRNPVVAGMLANLGHREGSISDSAWRELSSFDSLDAPSTTLCAATQAPTLSPGGDVQRTTFEGIDSSSSNSSMLDLSCSALPPSPLFDTHMLGGVMALDSDDGANTRTLQNALPLDIDVSEAVTSNTASEGVSSKSNNAGPLEWLCSASSSTASARTSAVSKIIVLEVNDHHLGGLTSSDVEEGASAQQIHNALADIVVGNLFSTNGRRVLGRQLSF